MSTNLAPSASPPAPGGRQSLVLNTPSVPESGCCWKLFPGLFPLSPDPHRPCSLGAGWLQGLWIWVEEAGPLGRSVWGQSLSFTPQWYVGYPALWGKELWVVIFADFGCINTSTLAISSCQWLEKFLSQYELAPAHQCLLHAVPTLPILVSRYPVGGHPLAQPLPDSHLALGSAVSSPRLCSFQHLCPWIYRFIPFLTPELAFSLWPTGCGTSS